jgi:hypothetical protein
MADTAFAQVAVPRKPVASTDNLIQWVPLTLVVSDYDTVTELLQKVEGRERDEYALTALRIGVLSLKHARGQIDADAVKREGERLMVDLSNALEQSRHEIHSNLTTALKDYFDPQSGRFQERLERLIKQDGDLEQVLRRQIGADGSEMAKTLAAHIGENSSLMKLLNPEESDGLVSSIRSTVADVIDKEQKCILSEFSLDNDGGALKRLVNELTHANGRLKDGLAEEIGTVVKEFSLDKEDSALSRLVRRVEVAEKTITKEFSLDEEDSALSRLSTVINGAKDAIDANLTLDSQESALFRLKGELVAILEKHEQRAEAFQANVQTAIESLKTQRKAEARSTEHGRVFEDVAVEFVKKEAEKTGDIASSTGNTTGLIKNCKVGDILIELGADCAAAGEKLVVEVKEDASYTLTKARGEIEVARKNRGAGVGLFLFSAKTAPKGMDALVRHGEDVFVVWDSDRIESDVVLRAGLSLGKALCVRQKKDRDAEDGNWDDIDAAILSVEKEAGRLANIKTWADTIQSNSGKILDEIRKMEKNLQKQVEALRDSVDAVKQL